MTAAATRPPAPWRRIAWYPLLLVVAYLAQPYTTWNGAPTDAVRVVLVAGVVAVVVTVVGTLALGRDRGAAAASVVLMALVAADTPLRLAPFVAGIALIALEARLARTGRLSIRIPWSRVTEALTVVLAILIVIDVVLASALRVNQPAIAVPAAWERAAAGARPDIYMILADGHGRADVLERSYGMDLGAFRTRLENLGFVESPSSTANYTTTIYSLSVLLNGRPLAELGQDMDRPADHALPRAAIRDSGVFRLLHASGYRIVALDSGYADVRLGGVDKVVDVGPLNEFERTLMDQTATGDLVAGGRRGVEWAHAERVLRQVDEVERLAVEPATTPRFVFAHLASPHTPYVFDADCRFTPRGGDLGAPSTPSSQGPRFVTVERDQTVCADRLLLRVADRVVAADPEAVVILLSDHGPGELLDWAAPAEPGAGNRFANLFWARTPGRPRLFPDDVGLVNVFPVLFNALWDLGLPIHPNDHFLGPTRFHDGFTPYSPPAAPGG